MESLSHRLEQTVISQIRLYTRQLEGLSRSLHDPSRLLGHQAQRVDDLSERLDRALQHQLIRQREQLARHEQHLAGLHPAVQISRLRQELLLLSERADRRVTSQLEQFVRIQGEATARLDALSPLHTLARGFTVVERQADGRIIRNAAELKSGQEIRLRFHKGTALCWLKRPTAIQG